MAKSTLSATISKPSRANQKRRDEDAGRPPPKLSREEGFDPSAERGRGKSGELGLGTALRSLRTERGWSLADAAARTGLSVSSLSKIENGLRSLTYDKLVQLANSLQVDISRLFNDSSAPKRPSVQFAGRRSVHREDSGFEVKAGVYSYHYLAHELVRKRFTPVIMDVHARTLSEFDELLRHEGDEFTYVLEGEIEVHTEIYTPLRLSKGQSVFFDSGVGHAYVNVGSDNARILCIGTDSEPREGEDLIPFALRALDGGKA